MNQGPQRCVWVSYASPNHPLVAQLTKHFNEQDSIRLLTYMRDTNSNEPLTEQADRPSTITELYLKPGESVMDLVGIIASTLRRMLVLSPEYLQSEHCLWEMASCFSLTTKVPLCLLVDFSSFSELLQPRKYGFIGDDVKHSLAEALAFVYKKRVVQMDGVFHLSDNDQQDLVDFYQSKLNTLNDRVYLTDGRLALQQLADSIAQYVDLFTTDEIVEQFELFYKKLYLQWCKEDYAKCCLALLKESAALDEDKSEFALHHLTTPNHAQITALRQLLSDSLIDVKEAKRRDRAVQCVKDFASLIALRMVDLEWAAEMRMSSISGVRLRLAVTGKDGSQRLFDSQLAASVIQQVPVKMQPNDLDLPIMQGVLTLKPLERAREQRQAVKEQNEALMLNLVMLLMRLDKPKAELFMTQANWQQRLRGRIFTTYVGKNSNRDVLTAARLYVEQQKFQVNLDLQWQQLADSFTTLLNDGAAEGERVRMATLIVSTRDEGNMIQLVNKSFLLMDHVYFLMECCDEQ